MKKFVLLCLLLAALPLFLSWGSSSSFNNSATENERLYQAEHHIVLVLDGPRYSETFGDSTCTYIPNLGKTLRAQGTFFSNFRNEGSTYTCSGHAAISTGKHRRLSNTGKKLPKEPSIFQHFLAQKKLDKRKAWILSSKGKLQILGNTRKKDWWNKHLPSIYAGIYGSGRGYPGDSIMWPTFKSIISTHKPKLALINLLDIDAWGHQNNWSNYLLSIQRLDKYSLELWEMIQSDPEMRNKTALYITTDHGRHLDGHKNGFISHGDKCEGCEHIFLLALGPDFEKGKTVSTKYDQIDLTASIAKMLDVEMPYAEGCAIPELVDNP